MVLNFIRSSTKQLERLYGKPESANTSGPKAPRRGTKSGKAWKAYYLAMAAWHEESADIIGVSMPDSAVVQREREEAARFREGADQISNKTHPNLSNGTWK